MIEPGDYVFDCLNRGASGRGWPAQHDNVDAEGARRSDLAVGRGTAAVLGNHHVDAMLGHQRMIVGFTEWAAAGDVADMRQRQRWIDRIDAADQIKCCGASRNGASSLRPSATKTRRGVCPIARTASPTSLASIHRSPDTAIQGGRRSATNGTPLRRAAATALAEITLA